MLLSRSYLCGETLCLLYSNEENYVPRRLFSCCRLFYLASALIRSAVEVDGNTPLLPPGCLSFPPRFLLRGNPPVLLVARLLKLDSDPFDLAEPLDPRDDNADNPSMSTELSSETLDRDEASGRSPPPFSPTQPPAVFLSPSSPAAMWGT